MTATRLARPVDAAVLADLAAATFALACPPHTTAEAVAEFLRDVLSERNFAEYLADPAKQILIAESDGEAVGYTMLVFGEPGDPDVAAAVGIRPTVELSKCYVRAGSHGHGAAAELMAKTLEVARAGGASGAWLGVNEENGRAIRFYEKNGFAKVGRKRFLVGGRLEDDFVLERAL
ncbi:GNAT family N-acetyltransferase [Luethyella okanaganae]|uniref:GNAT family N-acetyltransferase n=1 Tax=Luethyella okanaganae TaxID=69372 RepID=A0ABW1V9I0_9MICO